MEDAKCHLGQRGNRKVTLTVCSHCFPLRGGTDPPFENTQLGNNLHVDSLLPRTDSFPRP